MKEQHKLGHWLEERCKVQPQTSRGPIKGAPLLSPEAERPEKAGQRALRAYLQMRLSGKKQLDKYGIDVQRRDAYTSAGDCPIPIQFSPDRETTIIESASGWHRKKFAVEMQRRLEEFNRGEWEILVFPRGDRESRFLVGSFEHLSAAVKAGIPVWFARDRLLLTSEQTEEAKLAWDRYLDLIRDARAYIRVLRANTMGGRDLAMEDGRIPTGWGPWGLAGYDWKDGRFHKNEIAPTVERILRLYLVERESQSSITKALHGFRSQTGKLWWQSSVGKVLRHARWYAGIITYKGQEFRGLIDPIITEPEAELILKKLGHKPRPTAYGRAGWWTGRVTCGLCERRYAISKSHGCRCNGNDARLPEPCPAPSLGYNEFIGAVQEAVRLTLSHPESALDTASRHHREWTQEREILRAELQEKESTLAEYESRKERLSRQHEMRKLSDEKLLARLAEVESEERGYRERVQELQTLLDAGEPVKPAELADAMQEMAGFLKNHTPDQMANMPGLPVYMKLLEPIRFWNPPDNTPLESLPVLINSLEGSQHYEPASSPASDEVWRQLADRLNLRMVIYPAQEPGRKADIRVIGEFNPVALAELPAENCGGVATVNTLS